MSVGIIQYRPDYRLHQNYRISALNPKLILTKFSGVAHAYSSNENIIKLYTMSAFLGTTCTSLGSGKFGSCYLHQPPGEIPQVIKILSKETTTIEQFEREVGILESIKHNGSCVPYALCYIGSEKDNPDDPYNYYIITEYDPSFIELLSFLSQITITKLIGITIFANIYDAIVKLHTNRIAHLDIKFENILINPATGAIKIIDFGQSCNESSVKCIPNEKIGTPAYADLRLYYKINYLHDDTPSFDDYKNADFWAFGIMCVTFTSILNSDPLKNAFFNPNPNDLTSNIGVELYNYRYVYMIDNYVDYFDKKPVGPGYNETDWKILKEWFNYKILETDATLFNTLFKSSSIDNMFNNSVIHGGKRIKLNSSHTGKRYRRNKKSKKNKPKRSKRKQ